MSNHECEVCHKAAPYLYQIVTGPRSGAWACFACQPTAEVASYAGWAEREATKQHRAEIASKNFGHAK